MLRMSKRAAETAAAVALLAAGLYIVGEARAMPFGKSAVPGPGFLPMILGVILSGAAVGLLVSALRITPASPPVALGSREQVVLLLTLAGLGLCFEWLGAIPAIGLLFFACLVTLASLRWYTCALIGLGASVAICGFFERVLGVPLPAGLWGLW